MRFWTPERCAQAIEILRRSSTADDALAELSALLGTEVTRGSLDSALLRYTQTSIPAELGRSARESAGDSSPTERRIPAAVAVESEEPPELVVDPESSTAFTQFASLVDLVKRHAKSGGISLEKLCDELDMSPRAARRYLKDAADVGITIDVAHERLLFRAPEPKPSAPPVSVDPPSPITGRAHRIGVFSDLHYGSLYCLREQHREFVLRCFHELGIVDFFCPGDTLEGRYRHASFERSAESWDGQANEFLDWYPELPGTRLFLIDGNHDFTWTDLTGVESGRNLVRLARERGREDIHFFGSRGALVQYGPTRIELWHPKKGAAYALSYQLQNKIRDTAPERLPHILLTGHTHQYVKFRRSNVWSFYCGTFQHGDAPYGRSIGGDVALGGLVIDWTIDDDGIVRELGDSFKVARHEPKVFDVAV